MAVQGMSARQAARAPRARARGGAAVAIAAAVAATLTLSGCGLRWETEPPVYPSPDAVVAARDALADAEADVAEAATRAGHDADAVAAGAVKAAQAHLDALGGQYVAYPDASAAANPTASPSPQPTLAQAISSARATAEHVAATTDDDDLAFLARSITLDWAMRELWSTYVADARAEEAAAEAAASQAASASASPAPVSALPSENAVEPWRESQGLGLPPVDGSRVTDPAFVPDASTAIHPEALADIALKEDEARFAYETLAAQEFGPRRTDALDRARLHAARSDAVATLLDADPRTALYQLRDADLVNAESRRGLERSLETDLAARYAALLDGASPTDADWLLNASFDAYARAMRTDGFSEGDLPTLPGLVVGR